MITMVLVNYAPDMVIMVMAMEVMMVMMVYIIAYMDMVVMGI